ncbi:type II secretion system protein [Clostridium sp.]|jgi:prepilin-type N-terminal cleavage/methylation domain-containing protein|uniref:type II secretion system protein n=1 Tax=Clostridium sp. TaxID=1506 RepID=UPI002585EE52|nr:type II secretion system protein [Clostridium sp.]
MNNQIKRKGFSLIELIAVIAILGIAYAITFQIFTIQTRIYSNEIIKNDVQNSGRLCLNSLSDSIIKDSNNTNKPDPNPTDTPEAFTGSNFEPKLKILSYTQGNYWYVLNKNNNQLYKITTNNSSIVANNVVDVTVDNISNKLYKITVRINKGNYTKDFETEVSLRDEEGL